MDFNGMYLDEDYSEKKLQEISNSSLPVVVWGLGGMISFIIDNLKRYNLCVSYIVDNDERKKGIIFENIPVISFLDLKQRVDDCNIIIGVVTNKYVCDIISQIREDKQYSNVYFFELFYPFGKYAKEVIQRNEERICKVYDCLEDVKSKRVYEQKIQYLCGKKLGSLDEVKDDEEEQYFDKEIVRLKDRHGLFVDGGAYHGENTEMLFSRYIDSDISSICIDADQNNIKILNEKFADNPRVNVLYGALGKNNGTVFFENSGERGGRATNEKSGVSVPMIGIDDSFYDRTISMIKLDVEGSEMDSIIGASKVIKRDKPVLAICIYHYIEDHWKIVELIKKIEPTYKIYVRHYHYMGIETVVYAI